MMIGIDQAITYLRDKHDDTMTAISNRLEYIKDMHNGVKPKFHKGQYGKKYDHYTCGNCASVIQITDNYCWNCGYAVLWDSCRCLTGKDEDDAEQV